MKRRMVIRNVTSVGWSGKPYVRLDLEPVGHVKPGSHLYLEPNDPLAVLPAGSEIHISVCSLPAAKKK